MHRPLAITLFALTLSACATDAARVAMLPPPPQAPMSLAENGKTKIKCEQIKQTGSNRVTKRCYDVEEARKDREATQTNLRQLQTRSATQRVKGY